MSLAAALNHRLQRLRTLWTRYRIDRRLPPPVARLYRDTSRRRLRSTWENTLRWVRPVAGNAAPESILVQLGSRKIVAAGPLDATLFDLGHGIATEVTRRLDAAQVEHFVVARVGDGLEFGVELVDRERALLALTGGDSTGWYLDWADGARRGLVALDDAGDNRHVRRARQWSVFQAFSWGDRAVGADQAAVLSFWEPGTSGLLEKVGVRSQERFDERSRVTTEVIDGRPYAGRSAFPVGANLEHVVEPIDIVYTWVDGSDPSWQESFRQTAASEGRTIDEEALDPARFHSRDELKYSMRSVWAYCGWARTIWIVTAGQTPEWLGDDPRVRIVDHSEILPPSALPTFNSHAIEAALHHIDGLADQFVYFNDDMLVARSLRPEFFFTPHGLPRVYLSRARPPGVEDDDTPAVDTAALRGRELLATHFGRVATGKSFHSPYPLRASTTLEMEKRFAEVVSATQHNRFRSPDDLSTASAFSQHYALATGQAVLGEVSNEYVNVESSRLGRHLDRIRLGDDLDTYCINETNRDGADEERERQIAAFFDDVLPIAAPWER